MAVTMHITRRIVDEEPNANDAVTIRSPESESELDQPRIHLVIGQGGDVVYLSIEQARAVHAALGDAIAERS